MNQMLLKQMKYFVTVVECHSFTEAARLMAAGNRGFLPIEDVTAKMDQSALVRLPLFRGNQQLTGDYSLFLEKRKNGLLY